MAKRKRGKRGNGEGTIFQRKDDLRWVAAVTFYDADGKRKRRTVYADTYKDASDEKQKLLEARASGQLVAPAKETVGEFLEVWLRDIVPMKRRPGTVEVYRSIVAHHLIPTIGHLRLDRLRPEHIDMIQRRAIDAKLTPRTISVIRATLAAALRVAVTRGKLPRNVVALVDAPRIEPYTATVLTDVEAKQLLAAAVGDRYEVAYHLALYLGLRIGEVLGLRWQDVDFKKKRIHVRVQLQHRGPPPVFAEPKTKDSRRTLPLIGELGTLLRLQGKRQLEERVVFKGHMPNYGLVFTGKDGEAVGEAAMRAAFARLVKATGLPPMRFHDLRHSCATLLAGAGVSQRLSMAILGHASLEVNQLVYTHVMEEDLTGAIETLAEAIGAAETDEHQSVATSVAVKGRETA